MRLPKLLVIGPMKSGSTTLCELFSRNADIDFSKIKEPHILMRKNISDEEVIRGYSNQYGSSSNASVLGDGSTGYSKLPWCSPVPERANRILGGGIQIVFIKRNRIDRSISHHKHLLRSNPEFPKDFDKAIEQDKTIVRFSLYAPVIECWLDQFSRSHFHIIDFDTMIRDPKNALNPVLKALNLPGLDSCDEIIPLHANRGHDQKTAPSWIKTSFTRGRIYKEHVRHFVPDALINLIKKMTYKPAAASGLLPSKSTLSQLNRMFNEDEESLQNLMNARN